MMAHKRCALIFMLLFPLVAISQERELVFNAKFIQIKEEANYGLVNRGLNLQCGYFQRNNRPNFLLDFRGDFSFGANYRQGIGLFWQLKPIDIHIAKGKEKTSSTGPYASMNYQFQLYPELQSGHLFWFTHHEIGIRHLRSLTFAKRQWELGASAAVLGLTSRPEKLPQSESLFYDLSGKYIFKSQHSNMKLQTLNRFIHLNTYLKLQSVKRWTFAYEIDYTHIGGELAIDYLSHSINTYITLRNEN